jgi:phosphoglucosamine mutase
LAKLFGTEGIWGTYGHEVTDELAYALGHAVADLLEGEGRSLLIGRDTRVSSEKLERALAAGVVAGGATAATAGVIPAPAVSYLTRVTGAQAGAWVGGAHHAEPHVGMVFLDPNGSLASGEFEAALEHQVNLDPMGPMPEDAPGVPSLPDGQERYLGFLLEGAPRLEGVRVVVDCANGAGFRVAPEAYRRAGAEVVAIGADPDGRNINAGGVAHLEPLQEAVRDARAQAGLAHDGDARRVLLVDEAGGIVDGDQILSILALDAKRSGKLAGDVVVTTVMANVGVVRAMGREGIDVRQAMVGDRYVLEAMHDSGATLGGDPAGAIFLLDRQQMPDGIMAGLRLLGILAGSGAPISEIAAAVRPTTQVVIEVRVNRREALHAHDEVWSALRLIETELGPGGRVLAQVSGTEPLVRVMVEAESDSAARTAAERVAKVIQEALD